MFDTAKLLDRWDEWTDSPLLWRDLGTLWSGWRVGLWFLVINLVLGATLAASLATAADSGEYLAGVAAQAGLGQFLACVVLTALGGIVTVLVPVRAIGCYWSPRREKYFDQVVLSGISPSRYLFGKLLAQNAFLGMVVAVSLPYFIFALGLGGVGVPYLVEGVAALWVYGNLLTMVVLSLGAYHHEIGNGLGVILCFGVFYLLGLIPGWPLACIATPSHLFLGPLFATAGAEATHLPLPLGQGRSVLVGAGLVYFVSAAFWLVAATLATVLGPLHNLIRENSTFGEVVMDGDNRRKKVFMRRQNMRRASEIAFFYENRAPWVRRWEVPLRWGSAILLLVLPMAIIVAVVAPQMRRAEWDMAHGTILLLISGFALLAGMVFTGNRTIELTPVCWGQRRFKAGDVDTACWALLVTAVSAVVLVVLLLAMTPPVRRDVIEALQTSLPVLVLMLAWAYALLRYLCMDRWVTGGAYVGALCIAGALILAPLGIGTALREAPILYFAGQRALGEALMWLSPGPYLVPDLRDEIRRHLAPGLVATCQTLGYVVQGAILVLAGWLALWARRRLERRQKELPCVDS